MTPEQIRSIYAGITGRAVKRFSADINRPFHVEGVQWHFDPK